MEETKKMYRLDKFQERVGEFADDDKIVSLKEEVGILRMILEEQVSKCNNATDIVMNSHRLGDTIMKIEKVVISCDKLERRMGSLLSKRSVMQLAASFVAIINRYVDDPTVLERIADEMVTATQELDVLLLED